MVADNSTAALIAFNVLIDFSIIYARLIRPAEGRSLLNDF